MNKKNYLSYRNFPSWAKIVLPFLLMNHLSMGQEILEYQLPPKEIVDLVDAPQFPETEFSKDGKWMLILQAPGYQSIQQASQPVLGVAGLRINPITYTTVAENLGTFTDIKLRELPENEEYSLRGLPDELQLADLRWSPTGKHFAFLNKTMEATELWIAELENFTVEKVWDRVNDTYGTSYQWKPDGSGLLVQSISQDRHEAPIADPVPKGPIVQENLGGVTPSRTYQNLLTSSHDEDLMEFYLRSDLMEIDLQGKNRPINLSGIFRKIDYSPDGSYILTQQIVRPYSYLVPIHLFPLEVAVYSAKGEQVKLVHTLPLADRLPISFDAVLEGPRAFSWRKDRDATLVYTQAADEGDPEKQVDNRDELYQLSEPFDLEQAEKIFSGKFRIRDIHWGDTFTIIEEQWRKDRSSRLSLINSENNQLIDVISDRKSEDTYSDPGEFLLGKDGLLLTQEESTVFTAGQGASAEGDRPFLLKWNLKSGDQDTLYKSQRGYFENPLHYHPDSNKLYLSRESANDAPNIFVNDLATGNRIPITQFADPYDALSGVKKTQLLYPREDGLNLSATLYVPGDFQEGDSPLPVLIWAYPREFKTKEAASQVKGSPHRYPRLAFRSPVFWVTQGYAVLDQADMPIVGEGTNEPNDTFIEQIQSNAEALIEHVVSLGVADRDRIAVGGHSYGAFMTANLLAHTDLFAAGIARSGAYNRTLTPFGFQAEARTYWQAKETYDAMSPFNFAPQIKQPLLITHGIDDENSGTFPVQSERLYAAIKGHGGIVRLVMLPKEFHGYRSREGVLHTFWEQHQWLEKYVKNKK